MYYLKHKRQKIFPLVLLLIIPVIVFTLAIGNFTHNTPKASALSIPPGCPGGPDGPPSPGTVCPGVAPGPGGNCGSTQVPVKNSSGTTVYCEVCPNNQTSVNGECPIIQSVQAPAKYGCGSQVEQINGKPSSQPTSINFGCQGDVCNPYNPNYNGGSGYCASYHNPILDILFSILQFLSDGVGVVVVASVIVGGIQYTLARDNPEAVAKARGRIQTSLLALLVYVFAYAILNYLIPAGFFGQ